MLSRSSEDTAGPGGLYCTGCLRALANLGKRFFETHAPVFPHIYRSKGTALGGGLALKFELGKKPCRKVATIEAWHNVVTNVAQWRALAQGDGQMTGCLRHRTRRLL